MAQTTIPTASLPTGMDDPTMSAGLKALVVSATAGNVCNAQAHVFCVANTGSSNLVNGNAFKAAFGHHGDATGVSATGTIEHGNSTYGEVLVLTHNDGAANHAYASGATAAPFARAGASIGNGINSYNDATANFLLGPLVQPDTSHVKPIVIVTDHYANFPPAGTRAIPITGDGFLSPAGQVANVSPTDYATIESDNINSAMFISQNDTNGIRFVGIEFTTQSRTQWNPLWNLGYSYGLVRALGQGVSGSRSLFVLDGAVKTYLNSVARIHVGYPTISEVHVVATTPCSQTWSVAVPLSTPTLVCFTGLDTHWVAGRSTLTFVFASKDYPASDMTLNAMSSGAGSGQCAAGATNAGNDVEGNICVVDATHAYASVTETATSPNANGGVHNFYIDTYAAGGGSYSAGTEHSASDDALLGQYPQAWTLTCTDCPVAPVGGQIYLPNNGVPYTFVAQGTVGGGGATNWTATHSLLFGGLVVLNCTGVNVPVTGCTAPVVNVGTQTITAKIYATGAAPSLLQTALIHPTGWPPIGVQATGGEMDVLYKTVTTTFQASEGFDHCGPTKNEIFYVQRGGTYTEDCYGAGTHWTTAGLACSGTCSTAKLNLGSNITINSVTVISDTHLQMNYTLDADAETGAQHITFDHVWAHGSDGQIYSLSSTPGNLLPCNQNGNMVYNDCYVVNTLDTTTGILLDGPQGAVLDSYVSSIHLGINDSQAIGMAIGGGPALIKNNFASSTTENIFTGGGTGWVNNNSLTSAHDVEITGNYAYKPPAWLNGGLGYPASFNKGNCSATAVFSTGTHLSCIWDVKNGWETKGCTRCWVHENVIENNWVGAHPIYGVFNITPRNANDQGNPSSSIDDLTVENNLLVGVHNGVLFSDFDIDAGYGSADTGVDGGAMPAVQVRRVILRNNLWTPNQTSINSFFNYENYGANNSYAPRDILMQNNTYLPETGVVMNNTSVTYGGLYFSGIDKNLGCSGASNVTNNYWYINNVVPLGVGAANGCTPSVTNSNPTTTGSAFSDRFQGNVMPKPGNGTMPATTYYGTIPGAGIPTVATLQPPTYPQLDQSQPFTLDYTLNGNTGGTQVLTNWIGTGLTNTTNGVTAGVDMGPIQAMALHAIKGTPPDSTNPNIQTNSLAIGAVSELYTSPLVATGGTTPYTWSVASGPMTVCATLTNGLCIAASDSGSGTTISGTPTIPGISSFTVEVTDNVAATDTQPLSLTINPALSVATTSLSVGTVTVAYNSTLVSAGGIGPFTWSVTVGPLPPGLSLNASSGAITGTPTTVNTYNFTVKVTDPGGASATQPLSITINLQPTITTPSFPNGTVGVAYSSTATATGGVLPYTWSVSAGSLPPGLTLDAATGTISGTPTTVGTSGFTLQVADSSGPPNLASAPFTISIQNSVLPLIVTNTSFVGGQVTVPYLAGLTATGGVPPYTWDIASGALPTGLSITGAFISGVPTVIGTFTFTPRVTDSVGTKATSASPLNLTISPLAGSGIGPGVAAGAKVVVH